MLTSLNRMVGMPVIWQDKKIGSVERGIADPQARHLWGVVVRRGIGAAKWLPSDALVLVGERSVLARRMPESMPDALPSEMNEVYLTNGERVGQVSDGVLGGCSLKMRALEVSPGLLYRLMGDTSYAVRYHINRTREGRTQVVVPELLSRAEFKQKLREEDDE